MGTCAVSEVKGMGRVRRKEGLGLSLDELRGGGG